MSAHHVISIRTYLVIFAILLVLLVATIAVTQLEHGPLAVTAALSIATMKAVLIAIYFMHLRYASSLTMVFASAGVVWLVLMIGLMASDYLVRGPSLPAQPARSAATAPP